MSRYICAELAKETIRECLKTKAPMPRICKKVMDIAISAVDLTPTADVVEVVRCRDCKHHPNNGGDCDRSITHTSRDYVCECNTYRYINIDYCSYGERREGNEQQGR